MEETESIVGQISDLERLILKDNKFIDSEGKEVKIIRYSDSYIYKVYGPVHGVTRAYMDSLGDTCVVYPRWANAVYVGIPYQPDTIDVVLGHNPNFAFIPVQHFQIEKRFSFL